MGNYDTRAINFLQSAKDFPLNVSLDKKMPSWGLSRWKEKDCLKFVPSDDEGFTLRGDKRQLLYKGSRRSHRFTIHSDNNFEYDCILLREPESNVISLLMQGAENFDFFKQPYFGDEPFLKGSIAVYRKQTLIGQGTGKLCHIFRPLIIDARGRKVWGELSVVGNELKITIPEWWLASAKYPVTVDPTIGTSTVGSQYMWVQEEGEDPDELMFELSIPVNRFLVSEAINGLCTAYFYTNDKDSEGGGRPIIYSDNSNKPNTRKSTGENFINLNYAGSWRSGTFQANNISAGSYIWFGLFCEYIWLPRFDYGTRCYESWWWNNPGDPTVIPDIYPQSNWYEDFKLSMYFSYTSSQNYVRTLTQGINLTDKRTIKKDFKRSVSQTTKTTDERKIKTVYKRMLSQTSKITDEQKLKTEYKRTIKINQRIIDTFQKISNYIRCQYDKAVNFAETKRSGEFFRKKNDTTNVDGSVYRQLFIFIKLVITCFVRDYFIKRFLIAQEEIVLKSNIIREISFDSRI